MHPVLVTLPFGSGFPVFTFLIMLVVAGAAAIALAVRMSRGTSLARSAVIDVGLLAAFAGVFGARLFYLAFDDSAVGQSHRKIFDFGEGQLSVWGGLLAGAAAAYIYVKVKKIPLAEMADLYALPLAVGLCLGRVGCFLAGCCYGKIVPPGSRAGMLFPDETDVMTKQWLAFVDKPHVWEGIMKSLGYAADQSPSLPVYPTQLLFVALLALLSVVLYRMKRGGGFLLFLFLFSLGHFAVGFLRDDTALIGGAGIHLGQAIAAVVAVAALAGLFLLRRKPTDTAQ